MHVVYDHEALARQEYGGISRYVVELSTRVSRMEGCSAEVYAPLYVNRYVGPTSLRPKGMRIRRRRGLARLVLRINDALSRRRLPRRTDVSVFHETYFSPHDHCPRGARRVLTVYDMIDEELAPHELVDSAKATAIRRADHVICISEHTRQVLLQLTGIPEERTSVIYLAASLTADARPTPVVSQRPYLLYVGDRSGYKNFAAFVSAFGLSPRLCEAADIVAFGGGAFTPSEIGLIQAMSRTGAQVRQVAGDDAVLAGLYAGALALVYPSVHEGFGIPTLEAMQHDCPVICSGTSALPEVVGDAAEMFDPHNEADIRHALEAILDSESRRRDLVGRGRARSALFSWDRCAEETAVIYRRLVGQ